MDESRNHDGAGVALIALVLVVLLVFAVASYYWLTRRALVERERAAVAQAETEDALKRAQRAAVDAAQRLAGGDPAMVAADAEAEIRQILQQQLDAWNAGDIEGFMQHYWMSDNVTLSSGGNLTRGWQETLDGYRQRYPSPEEMGRTTFENLEFTFLSPEAALVIGDWRLMRDADPLGGKFSLVLRRIDDRWVIIHDHTSRSATQ